MARSLGSLGTQHDEVDAEFDYFGLVVRVHPNAGDLELIEFLMNAAEVDAVDQMAGMAAISRYLRGLIHPDDWDVFWRQAKAHRQNMNDLMELGRVLIEEISGFPTQRPTGSSGGPTTTKRRSKGGSSSAAARTRSDTANTRRALELVSGRPDLKEMIVLAHEARTEAAAG